MEPNSCPWGGLPPAAVDFCEANRCGWIVEPMNTLSSLAFVAVGILLWRRAIKNGEGGLLGASGPISILIGVFSSSLHATMTQAGNFLDLASMYLMGALLLFLNWRRYRVSLGYSVRDRQEKLIYVATICGSLLIHAFFPMAGIPIFALFIFGFTVLEILLFLRRKTDQRRGTVARVGYLHFWGMGASFILSGLVWALDISGTVCWPESVFQGHALWHVGCAVSIVFAYLYFRQFPLTITGQLKS
jgi:hypothetical protein